MYKLTLLGLLSFTLSSSVIAQEYMMDEYSEEAITYPEIISNTDESAIIFDETDEASEIITIIPNNVASEEKSPVVLINDNNYTTDEVSEEFDIYLNALKEAKSTGKMIILAVRATDCHYCDEMDRTTLTDSGVQSALEKDFLMLHYNQDLEPLPLGLQEGMTPIFIFVDKNENVVNQYPGMRTPEEFKQVLKEMLSQ